MTNPSFSPQQLLIVLRDLGIAERTVEHAAVSTVEESQKLRGLIPGLHSKNLFLKDKKGRFWLVVAEEDRRIELKALRSHLGATNLSFASAEHLHRHLGVEPGSVTPFAVINDRAHAVQIVLDKQLVEAELVNFHPLTNTQSTTIRGADLLNFLTHTGHTPLVLDFATLNENGQSA